MLLCYESVLAALQTVLPAGVPTQLVNLALLVSAFLLKRSCTLSELARAYPIAEEAQATNATDGKVYLTQYFERAVFEYHPENAGTEFEVELSLLGVFYYNGKYGGSAPQQHTSTTNPRLFNETGFTMGRSGAVTTWN